MAKYPDPAVGYRAGDARLYSPARVGEILAANASFADAAAGLLLRRTASAGATKPSSHLDRALAEAENLKAAAEAKALLDAAHDEEDAARNVLRCVAAHAGTCLASNAYVDGRRSLALALDPAALYPDDEAARPAGVIFVHGRGFDGFHVRYRDVARGGVRLVTPRSREAHALEATRHLDECAGLAAAQQRKNKDIPEGGSKGVILAEDAFDSDERRTVAFRSFVDGLLDLVLAGTAPRLYLGPDASDRRAGSLSRFRVRRSRRLTPSDGM